MLYRRFYARAYPRGGCGRYSVEGPRGGWAELVYEYGGNQEPRQDSSGPAVMGRGVAAGDLVRRAGGAAIPLGGRDQPGRAPAPARRPHLPARAGAPEFQSGNRELRARAG